MRDTDDVKRNREKALWSRWVDDQDVAARNELVELYLPLARRMAGRYSGVAEPWDDLMQVASLGLLKAIERFDPANGTPFAGFAKPTIHGELKRHFRDKVWTVRMPRSLHDLIQRVESASEDLTLESGGRAPSVARLSDRIGADPVEVLEALEAMHNRSPLALDPLRDDGDDEGWMPGWAGETDPGYERVEDQLMLASALPRLEDRDAEILRLRFLEEMPQTRIAERMGCSQMQVSRILRRTIDGLREELAA